jgi:hypothetical protein
MVLYIVIFMIITDGKIKGSKLKDRKHYHRHDTLKQKAAVSFVTCYYITLLSRQVLNILCNGKPKLSHVWLSADGVWIGNWIYWTLTDLWLQVTIALSIIRTLYNSLQHAISLFNLLRIYQSLSGNGFQRRKFPLLWVPELSPCFSYQLSNSSQGPNRSSPLAGSLSH